MTANPLIGVVLADPMAGVRDAWRWLLAAQPWAEIAGEASTIAEALAAPGDVVLSGLRLGDGAADRLIAAERRPVVVWTFLPPDERDGVDLSGSAAVIGPGELRERLGPALREAVQLPAPSATATPPRRAARREA